MRIIAGDFKGFRLRSTKGMGTRPTSDKIKETIFNMIGPFFSGGLCLDLFAGSGSLGLEALSRGIDKVVFVDKNQQAIKCVYQNIEHVKSTGNTKVLRMDAFRTIKFLANKQKKFNLIILDPPYDEIKIEGLLKEINIAEILAIDGIIMAEHKGKLKLESNSSFNIAKEKLINQTTTITILKRKKDS